MVLTLRRRKEKGAFAIVWLLYVLSCGEMATKMNLSVALFSTRVILQSTGEVGKDSPQVYVISFILHLVLSFIKLQEMRIFLSSTEAAL